ncbi:MAG: hypothetical protein AAF297_01785 [Planctomycetota bacterium]
MARNALAVLAVALFMVIIAVVLVGGGGGIDRSLKSRVEMQLAKFDETTAAAERNLDAARSALADEPVLLSVFAETWPPRIERAESDLASAETTQAELTTLLAANDPETEVRVAELAESLSASLAAGAGVAAELATNGRELIEFRDRIPVAIQQMEQDRDAIETVSLANVEAAVRRAQGDWPEKAGDLGRRLAALTGAKAAASQMWADSATAREAGLAGDPSAEQVRALASATEAMSRTRADLEGSDRLLALIDELYFSWDRVLADMGLNEGSDVTFSHTYRTVYVPATLAEDGSSDGREPRTENETVTVTKAEYDAMKNNLGMAVSHKPAGKYDHEAERMVQPPGYAYVAEPGRSNRYGSWNGGFWVWYGQYALMRDLFWGPSYRRIGMNDYSSYNRHRSTGRTYYGESGNRYGSKGMGTRQQYGSSRYVQTNGYANSRYERSGGTYRGSRFESRSRSASRSSRSGGFSRSGSRGGGK